MKAGWALLLFGLPLAAGEVNPVQPEAAKLLRKRARCLRYAEEVANVLAKRGKETEHGLTFAKSADVYAGDAGVALFFIALHRATKKRKWLELGRGALANAFATRDSKNAGLYTGSAGIGQVCLDAWHATGDKKYLEQARACASNVGKHRGSDVIVGAAGTGIFLLNLHGATQDARYLKEARRAGDYLVRTAIRKKGRASWAIYPGRSPTVYVGLSHGAAGIGYFLLHLHRATKEKAYRGLAEEAARFVLANAIAEGEDGYHWERTVPPQKGDTIRIQWCHGAPGIGLFFSDMVRHLGGDTYRKALLRCIATTKRLGRSARRSGCQCHGVAGNAEVFVEAFKALRDPRQLETAREFGSVLLVPAGKTYRVRTRGYDSSYMTGLAGIGHFFLRLANPKGQALPMMVNR